MALGDGHVYNTFKRRLALGQIDLGSGGHEIKIILVTGHTLDLDNDEVYADVAGDEVSGDGYTEGGKALTGQSVTQDNVNDRAVWNGNNVTWTALDVTTPNYAIAYDSEGDPSPPPSPPYGLLLMAWEVSLDSDGRDYTLNWDDLGIALIEQG
jgi:hypothetical protein